MINILKKYIDKDNILFVTQSNPKLSSDVDIYCVTKSKRSSVHIFKENNMWYELFIDNITDANQKMLNIDQICINFLTEMEFCYGDREEYEKLRSQAIAAKNNYHIPNDRRNKIVYRIKVLSSKIFNPNKKSRLQRRFLINSISYPTIELILEKHSIFPSSPKNWIYQIKDKVKKDEFKLLTDFLDNKLTDNQLRDFLDLYVGDLESFDIDKSKNNSTTFIT